MFNLSHQDNVSTLTLCHPPANAISHAWLEEFDKILDQLEDNTQTNVLHLRSDQKIFCAGADLKEYQQRMANNEGPDEYRKYLQTFHRLFGRLESLAKLSIAEIGGAALGGGFELDFILPPAIVVLTITGAVGICVLSVLIQRSIVPAPNSGIESQ